MTSANSLNQEIKDETIRLPSSHTVRYRLLSARRDEKTVYSIQITLNEEQSTQTLPCMDRQSAIELYERIKRGTVTPCTLEDILEDLK